METNLQHEDLLIKLRSKLNEEKIKLWESPFIQSDQSISDSLKELSKKIAMELSLPDNIVLPALHELQLHSIDRSKANSEFKETGLATFRVRATVPGEKAKELRVQLKLESAGKQMIEAVAKELAVTEDRVKLIFNGKVIQLAPSLQEQGVKNGTQIMALLMALNPEQAKKEDLMYLEMKSTRDDAMLLSEVDDFETEEYIKLEDQTGNTVELPPAERRSLMVGLALHERGRAAAKTKDFPLALVLLLEADRQLSECSSSILESVDNVAVLQLDIAWCYLCLQSLASAGDAAARLARAERAMKKSYGEDQKRVVALKGTDANERALMMRLHLLQGIVNFHQNRRDDARRLLEKAEVELNSLRVDEGAVTSLMELGWSMPAARRGLRAARGDVTRAHHYLADTRQARDDARRHHRTDRERRALGLCDDGTPVNNQFVDALVGMGFTRRLATLALRTSNNHVAEAVRMIQEQPEMLECSEDEEIEEEESPSSEDSSVEPDNKLVGELEAMGYGAEEAKLALKKSRNRVSGAVDLLVAGPVQDEAMESDSGNPSTSAASTTKKKAKKHSKKKHEREEALRRLTTAIHTEEDDHLDTSLVDEEEFLAQYKSLL